ncbi:hypothetical protein KAR91_21660 [Candidatus Pacearchaeota archaeon]|nr:hypothetical protein [Candidatus Pacearchaeota archaeon]
MNTSTVFFISFVGVAFIYAITGAFTKIFYKNKSIADLSHFERNVLYDRATIGNRIALFVTNLFSSIIAPPVYILAGIITFIIWILPI